MLFYNPNPQSISELLLHRINPRFPCVFYRRRQMQNALCNLPLVPIIGHVDVFLVRCPAVLQRLAAYGRMR